MLCARKGTVTAMFEKIVNSVKKALDILDILIFEDIDRRGISLKELSERSGIRPNTLHNILKTMKQCGYEQSVYDSGALQSHKRANENTGGKNRCRGVILCFV